MIKKTSEGYQVVSHTGKPLSDNDLPYTQAKDRLKEVEFFKRVKKAQDEGKKKPKPQGYMTMEEMKKRKEFQDRGFRNPNEKPMDDSKLKYVPPPPSMDKTNKVETKNVSETPFDRFNRTVKSLDKRKQESINKVLYGK